MMGRCAVRRGFFVLRPCGRRAFGTCARCGRPACGGHLAAVSGQPWCAECRARARDAGYEADWTSDLAALSYRQRFYASRPHQQPHHVHYDSGDYGAFDSGPADPRDDLDAGGGGFYES